MQTHQDKKFGELAIEEGYLTEEQVNALLEAQKPDYLLLGQALIEKGILTNTQFENILIEYQSDNEIYNLRSSQDFQKKKFDEMIHGLGDYIVKLQSKRLVEYLQLFNYKSDPFYQAMILPSSLRFHAKSILLFTV